ncbi:MAG: hypothetical protein K8S16_20460 [Bacteroidales bacterium]|nr:hypothetical protein [Bacteroidales bacterium]
MKNNSDEILIDKYFQDKLNDRGKELFKNRIKTDKSFLKEFEYKMALIKALKKANEEDLEEKIDVAIQKADKITTSKKRTIIMYSVVSAAASVLLMLFIYNTTLNNRNEIENYLALSGSANQIEVNYIHSTRSVGQITDSLNIIRKPDYIKISSVQDDKLFDKCFMVNNILYTQFDNFDRLKIIMSIDREGKKIYFICKDEVLFKLPDINNIKENKIYTLQIINDNDIITKH